MTNKRKNEIRALANRMGIRRRVAATRLDAERPASSGAASGAAGGAAYGGPRGDAAPAVSLRELWSCVAAGVVTCNGDSGGWSIVEPPPVGATADIVARCRSAMYVEAMEKNNWATEARHALAQIGRDIATAYAETVRKGKPQLCPGTAPTPPTVPAPGERVLALEQFQTDAGWRSIMFSISAPFFFQYRIEADERSFTASARGHRRERDGRTSDALLVLRGRLDEAGALWTTAIEETWTASN